jgi:hypothetical protein
MIPAYVPAFEDGTAYISLENVSNADAYSETVAEIKISGLSHAHASGDTQVPFVIHIPSGGTTIDPWADYAVQAWVDCSPDGRISKGDLVSDQVYRVLTGNFDSKVTIILRQIR